MLSKDKLLQVKKLVTHKNCTDGLGSAMVVLDALPSVEVVWVQYNEPEYKELIAEPGMLFCDVIPPVDRYQEFIDIGALVLDHHKGAEKVTRAFGENGVFADEVADPGVSGAVLAYRYVWEPLMGSDGSRAARVREFAERVGIRDTWNKADSRWEEATLHHQVLSFYPPEMWVGLEYRNPKGQLSWFDGGLGQDEWEERAKVGRMILKKHEKSVRKKIQESYRFTTYCHHRDNYQPKTIVIFEGTGHTSDAAELLDGQVDMIVGFNYSIERQGENAWDWTANLRCSCRSHGKVNVAEIAKRFGGGGHTNAAAFALKVGQGNFNPYREIAEAVNSALLPE